MSPIESESVYSVCDRHELSKVPDGYVIYQADREKVHYLNQTAVVVYELCDGSRSVAEIEAFLQSAFDLPEEPVKEVRACIESLVQEGLLRPCRSYSLAH